MKTITITMNEYISLMNDQRKLGALETNGVENWTGFDLAMEDYSQYENEELIEAN